MQETQHVKNTRSGQLELLPTSDSKQACSSPRPQTLGHCMAQVNPSSIFSKRPVKDLTKENIPSRDSALARHESQTAPCGVSRSLASVSPQMPSEVAVGGGGSYKERKGMILSGSSGSPLSPCLRISPGKCRHISTFVPLIGPNEVMVILTWPRGQPGDKCQKPAHPAPASRDL